MPNPYGDIFKAAGAKSFSAAGFVARMPLSMTTIGIVTMLSQTHGEYWLAGAVSATFALANALLAPQVSRLVDRYGQSRVLVPATIVAVAALVALMTATRYRTPIPVLFLTAAVAGVMPSMAALVRARWVALYRDTPQLRTAFAFESVVDEVIFILGPITAIGLSVSVFPEAGPLAATLLLAIGTALFAIQKATEPPVHPPRAAAGTAVIGLRSVQTLALAFAAMGSIFGTAEVTAVAFAEAHGHKAAASLVLASYAAGSMIAGLIFGALTIKLPLARQFVAAITLAAVMTWPLLLV
ncbi:MAG TPA: MFS transporter, partial [Vineibacter sp.]|nr:MFS transporter [Vineibacter sp.]